MEKITSTFGVSGQTGLAKNKLFPARKFSAIGIGFSVNFPVTEQVETYKKS